MTPPQTCNSEEDFERLFNLLAEIPSFTGKGEVPKMMRWFSTNSCFKFYKEEFWVLKMVLEHTYGADGGDGDDLAEEDDGMDLARVLRLNPRKEFQALRAGTGGLKLAQKLVRMWLHRTIRVYYYGTKACWSWYTEMCKDVKTPQDNLNYIRKVQTVK